jgi:hypothetical protein
MVTDREREREREQAGLRSFRNLLSPHASSKFQDREIANIATKTGRISFYWVAVSTNDLISLF